VAVWPRRSVGHTGPIARCGGGRGDGGRMAGQPRRVRRRAGGRAGGVVYGCIECGRG